MCRGPAWPRAGVTCDTGLLLAARGGERERARERERAKESERERKRRKETEREPKRMRERERAKGSERERRERKRAKEKRCSRPWACFVDRKLRFPFFSCSGLGLRGGMLEVLGWSWRAPWGVLGLAWVASSQSLVVLLSLGALLGRS